jgi:hypothetical protein
VESITNKKPWFRFSVAFLLSVFLGAALLLTVGRKAYNWFFAIPTVPLAGVVASFNSRSLEDRVGRNEPPITETEIVSAIRSQLSTLRASSKVKAIYADIARTRELPHDASLHSMSGWTWKDGTHYTVWWINLDVFTGPKSGYGLRIRENNQPIAKPPDEPKLQRSNLSWISGPTPQDVVPSIR